MNDFETLKIENVETLKQSTIFFFLKSKGFSENYIKNLRNSNGAILLNGKTVNIRAKIKNGDCLQIKKSPNKKTEIFLCDGILDILYEDEDFLIVNKPHNLACMPNRAHYINNLGGQICTYMQQTDENFTLRILNRLDKETAGIVVVAKNVLAYNKANFDKIYHAICEGVVKESFTINKPILTVCENGINQTKRIISEQGKKSITHIQPIQALKNNLTLLKLRLETGRTHQIRVHTQSCKIPLLGDQIYGSTLNNLNSNLKNQSSPNHAMLILKQITLTHFRTNKKIEIEVPYPDVWNQFLN